MQNSEKKYSWQTCQDEELNREFYKLHHSIVNQIIAFCKEHNVEIDDVQLSADGLRSSIEYGEWCPGSDSSLTMYRFDNEHPYRQNLSMVEPFLCSM